jgi:hypothetical protein
MRIGTKGLWALLGGLLLAIAMMAPVATGWAAPAGKVAGPTGASALPGLKLASYDASVGAPITLAALTIFPIYGKSDPRLDDAVSLELALERGKARVREVGSEGDPSGATVGTLVVDNLGTDPVFVLAGTVVKGGKQDRQIAQDFVIAAKETVDVQAFCVEHGRWNAERDGKSTGGSFSASGMLAPTSVRVAGTYENDQGKVWEEVEKTGDESGKTAASGTLMATYDDAELTKKRRALAKEATEKLAAVERPEAVLGLAYAVGGKVRNVRWFANRSLWDQHRGKLLQTAAVEAMLWDGAAPEKALAARAVRDFIEDAAKAAVVETKKAPKAMNRNHFKKGKRAFASEARLDAPSGEESAPVTVDISAQ